MITFTRAIPPLHGFKEQLQVKVIADYDGDGNGDDMHIHIAQKDHIGNVGLILIYSPRSTTLKTQTSLFD